MNKNSNIHNIYVKNTKTYNKNTKNNGVTEKNNILFIKNNNLIKRQNSRDNSKSIKYSKPQKNFQHIYYNENKKKLIQENNTLILENIPKTNAVNIQNINLINSMNNITVYDSYHDNNKKEQKSINKLNSQKIYNTNNYSEDLNTNNNQKNNIIVNKKKILLDNKNNDNNTVNNKTNSKTKKKNSFNEFNYKKLNSTFNNFKSFNKYNRGNNYSNFNKKDNKNDNLEIMSHTEIYQSDLSQMKNRNNSMNKSIIKENNTNKTELSLFNTCSNYTNSLGDEEINEFNKKMILIDKMNNKQNFINVNKINTFKINVNSIKNNTDVFNNKSNTYNLKTSPNSSNIFCLLSNKNINNGNKKQIDKEYLNKLKKNMIKEKFYKTKSKDSIKMEKKQNNKKNNKKTESEEKICKKNKDSVKDKISDNQEITKKIKIFSSFLNENNRKNSNTSKRLGIGNTYINNMCLYDNNTCSFNSSTKLFYSSFNSDNNSKSLIEHHSRKNIVYPNRINYHNKMQQMIKKSLNNKHEKENKYENNKYDTDIFEKIEVNKKNFPKIIVPKINNKNHVNQINKKSLLNRLDTRNECQNIYAKKSQQESWVNSSEQANSFSKNMDTYCYLSNYKEKEKTLDRVLNNDDNSRKKSAPKKTISNLIYNKKQLLCCIKKGKQNTTHKVVSPDWKNRKICLKELTEEISQNIKNNIDEDISFNFNNKNNENTDEIKEINKIRQTINNAYLLKSPKSTIYKKPNRNYNINNNSNLSIINGKDSFNNKLSLYTNKVITNENYLLSSKKKSRKKQFNIKLNKFIKKKEFSDDNNIINSNNININNNNYNNDELPKIKESIIYNSINTYKTIKNDLSSISNNESNKSKEFIINTEQFSFKKLTKKVPVKNCFCKKYCCYFIDYKQNKIECFITKKRIDKNNLLINEIPIKKICYYSKKRKRFVKKIPKIEICHFKKYLIISNKNDINNNKIMNKNRNNIEEENNQIINEFDFIKKEVEENNKLNFQYSFASINSYEQNNSENSNNYFEISFGKKSNKSIFNLNNELIKNKLNNNDKFKTLEDYKVTELFNSTKIENENKFLNNNIDIDISMSKNYLNKSDIINNNDVYLKKTEEGLKLLEKIADNRISSLSYKKKNINQLNNDIKNIFNENKSFNNIDKFVLEPNELNDVNNDMNNTIKNDFIELLNMLVINNYDIILNKISNLILNNHMITINNISQLSSNQNEFVQVIINKAIVEEKYIKIYSKICKDLFISLMTIIDNYNDDMDIFDKITKDKSLKVILKNSIIEKMEQFDFAGEPSFGVGKNNIDEDPFFCDIKLKFTGIINFVGELLEVKLISLKSGFEILDILYKRYNKGNNNINMTSFNDLNLQGIEILLKKMKIIAYEKNNPEHIQRYNKYIKNYLNNIFKIRIKRNDLPKFLYYRLYNIIENQKNEEEIKKQQKVKTFVNFKNNIPQLNILSGNDKSEFLKFNNNNNSFTILENKYNIENTVNNKSQTKDNKESDMIEQIKRDIEKYLFNTNINEEKTELLSEINKKYKEEINIKKNLDIWEIFYYYIEVCIDVINSEEKVYKVTDYIENFINNFIIDIPNESWEMLHYKLISLFLNVNGICADNVYMYQIMGFLLFLLIQNKLFFIKDLNNFLNKDNQIIINIAKVVKYTIIFADKDAKKFHNDFKQTKLFIGNDNFYNIVTLPLRKKFL